MVSLDHERTEWYSKTACRAVPRDGGFLREVAARDKIWSQKAGERYLRFLGARRQLANYVADAYSYSRAIAKFGSSATPARASRSLVRWRATQRPRWSRAGWRRRRRGRPTLRDTTPDPRHNGAFRPPATTTKSRIAPASAAQRVGLATVCAMMAIPVATSDARITTAEIARTMTTRLTTPILAAATGRGSDVLHSPR